MDVAVVVRLNSVLDWWLYYVQVTERGYVHRDTKEFETCTASASYSDLRVETLDIRKILSSKEQELLKD
jgi:hypothetical protein